MKPYAALEYETSQMMAHGAACSIGDQLHPRGRLDRAVYDLVGKVYARVQEREPWLEGATPLTQIGLFTQASGSEYVFESASGTDEGATRMLTQLKHQFDAVSEASDLEKYELLILPDAIRLSQKLIKRLCKILANGGKLLATGTSGLSADGKKLLLPELGIVPDGMSPFTATYVRWGERSTVPDTDHVMYDRAVRVTARRGSRSVAGVVKPYFERAWNHFSSHYQTPPDKPSRYSAAVCGKQAGYIPFPVFSSFAQHANLPCRWLVAAVLDRLLPEPVLRSNAPSGTETSVMVQGERVIMHVLHYSPERRGKTLDIIEDNIPLHDIHLSLKFEKKPGRVYLAPAHQALEFRYEAKRVEVTIPRIEGHAMVVIEP